MFKDYYKILEVSRNATADDIKISYRNLAKKYHPDSNSGVNDFTKIMQDINEAYDMLKTEEKRNKYNLIYDIQFAGQKAREEAEKRERERQAREEAEKQERERQAREEAKNGLYIWTGTVKTEAINGENFKNFRKRMVDNLPKAQLSKNEFETTAEYNLRIQKAKIEFQERLQIAEFNFLNRYFGFQNVEMTYNADNEIFYVTINKNITFKIKVPREIAQNFKIATKNFIIVFDKNENIVSISTQFRGTKYSGELFNKNFYNSVRIKLRLDSIKSYIKSNPKKSILFGIISMIFLYLIEDFSERVVFNSNGVAKIGNLMFQDGNLPDSMNWQSAMNYCENLNYAGFSDWRLPTIEELRIAYEYKHRFYNVEDSLYWSSTISKNDTSYSWILDFNFCYATYYFQGYDILFRCVR